MAELSAETSRPPAVLPEAVLVCRLRQRRGRDGRGRGQSPTAGEVELENTSSAVVEIEVQMSPLQYLNLVVRDAGGSVVSDRPYGGVFSPLEQPCTLRLQPGEKYVARVSLLGNVPREKQSRGAYTVQAVYEYRAIRAVSDPLTVHLGA